MFAIPDNIKRNLRNKFSSRRVQLLTIVLVFGVVGVITLVLSYASSPAVSIEPETATISGSSSVINDTTASGGAAIQFGKSNQSATKIRAAFYYPWFPEAWNQLGINPYTNYNPTLGFYDSTNPTVINSHIDSLIYAGMNAAVYSWWGQGSKEDLRFSNVLSATGSKPLKWSLYYECEGNATGGTCGNIGGPSPTIANIQSDLSYIRSKYGSDSHFLLFNNKPVIFVYGDATDSCTTAANWKTANGNLGSPFYVVLKVFSGYANCPSQPDNWHQYAPASAIDVQSGHAVSISPGFWKKGHPSGGGDGFPYLARNLATWQQNVTSLKNSTDPIQLVTTFNEWGEGSAVESANEWSSASGNGSYLDILHNTLVGSSDAIPPSVPGNLTATASSQSQINLNWSASTDNIAVIKYNILRGGVLVNSVNAPATSFSDTGLSPATSYSYTVQAQDAAGNKSPISNTATATTQTSISDPVITAAGDISCDPVNPAFSGGTITACQQRATSNIINTLRPSAALTLGDNQYETGSLSNFNASFNLSWGIFKSLIHPAIGNHEGGEGGSNAGYFDYFNGSGVQTGQAGDRSSGYYSYNIGKWHLISLNSNCGTYSFNGSSNGCASGSTQENWLKTDLAAHPNVCTLAYWHVPRFSSGSTHHNDASTDTVYTNFWTDLYSAGADIVLNGHDHDYERFAPLSPSGVVDASKGISEFIVGTGGDSQYSFTTPVNGSLYRGVGYGVLKLTLHDSSYDWQFINAPGTSINDSGTTTCHKSPNINPPPDTSPPTVPGSFSGSATSPTSVNLRWSASQDNVGVNSYRIYRNGNVVGSVNGTTLSYTDNSAIPNTSYSYQVSALDVANNESGLSQVASVTTPNTTQPDTSPPTAPSNLTGTFVPNTQINLSWTGSHDNVGVAGYKILRNNVSLNSNVQTTSFGDNTVSANNSYVYSVTAFDAAGNSSPAATVTVSTTVIVPPPNAVCGLTSTAPAKYKHVIWLWMENHSYSAVIGSAAAPYQTSLANQCATNSQMRDAGSQYNSLSNYIAATSGLDSCSGGTSCGGNSTWNDCDYNASSCQSPNDNIFNQVRVSGGTAKSYEEDMPSNCFKTNSGNYAIRHNPAAYFTFSNSQAACQTDDMPMGSTTSGNFLNALASDASLPTFSFITPNVCNDTHDCSVATGDAWLKSWMPLILNSPAYKSGDTAVALWYDEDTPIPNVMIAPSVKHVSLSDSTYSHYSLLRSSEEMLGLPFIGKASSAPSLRSPYNL